MGKILHLIFGVILLIAGVIGLLLPVVPQIPFLVLGFSFLMIGSRRFSRWFKSTKLYREKLKAFIQKNRLMMHLFLEDEEMPQ